MRSMRTMPQSLSSLRMLRMAAQKICVPGKARDSLRLSPFPPPACKIGCFAPAMIGMIVNNATKSEA